MRQELSRELALVTESWQEAEPATWDYYPPPQPGPQTVFCESDADIAIMGGAAGGGKSFGLLLIARRWTPTPGYNAVVLRREMTRITRPGGLWDESMSLYLPYSHPKRSPHLRHGFDAGSVIQFDHLQYEQTKYSFHGAQICGLCFDQLEEFTEGQFWYMLSRNRSICGVRPFVRATCNPDPDSFLVSYGGDWGKGLISWWIGEDGLPIQERSGVERHFIRYDEELHWADTPEELTQKFRGSTYEIDGEQVDVRPRSMTFIPSKLEDNPALTERDPGYMANLMALPYVERLRLLGGNWLVKPEAGLVFNRVDFEIVDEAPMGGLVARGWDKAGTPGSGAYTAGVKMLRTDGPEDPFVVLDVVRGQWGYAEREEVMKRTAELDGPPCVIYIEQEGGSGGKESAERSLKLLAPYKATASVATGSKLARSQGMAAHSQAHKIKLVRAPWNDAYLSEMHGFTGEGREKKDQVDASSLVFNELSLMAIPRKGKATWGR